MIYALKEKGRLEFSHASKTEDELEKKIEKSYWQWKGCQNRDTAESTKTKEVYLERFNKVKLTIEII